MIPCIVKVKGAIPLVVESHSICCRTINNGRNYLHKVINRFIFLESLKKADVVVALTNGDANEWKKYHPFVVVIPNMVHLNRGTNSPLSSKKIIFVGRFDYQKRVQEAIRIWSMIHPKYPDWVLDIYGEGELQKDIEDSAKRVGGISINPPTSFIFDCYRKSSILISTSLFEPFGLVIPEAMSCGLPVVAYNCKYGPADIVSDGVDGFLIKQDDINAFVEKLSMLISSLEMRKRMGNIGIHSVRRFEASKIMPLWQDLFQQLNHKNNKKTN
jgi:glycosyltransferase involved in cell wall biosynthesis